MKAVVGAAPLIVCLLVIISSVPTAANPLWNLDQVGGTYLLALNFLRGLPVSPAISAYFSGIFRSIVGPLFGFGLGTNSTAF